MDETNSYSIPRFHSLCAIIYQLTVGICLLNRAAKFVRSVLHCISTERRKLSPNLATINKLRKDNIFSFCCAESKTSFSTSFFV